MTSSESTIPSNVPADSKLEEALEIIYQGPDVNDGSMDARQFSEALSGIADAFSTVANEINYDEQYKLRITSTQKGSFHILLSAIAYAQANPAPAVAIVTGASVSYNAVRDSISGLYRIIVDIITCITSKKKLQGRDIKDFPINNINNDIRIMLPTDTIILSREQYDLLVSKRLDKPISQMVSPLAPQKIDLFSIKHSDSNVATVKSSEKDYFNCIKTSTESTENGIEITGTLNSLSKSNRRGTFYTLDGRHIPYRYDGNDDSMLMKGFSSQEPVIVRGSIKYDRGGSATSLEIKEISILQRRLF
jgi:hypothetical protein